MIFCFSYINHSLTILHLASDTWFAYNKCFESAAGDFSRVFFFLKIYSDNLIASHNSYKNFTFYSLTLGENFTITSYTYYIAIISSFILDFLINSFIILVLVSYCLFFNRIFKWNQNIYIFENYMKKIIFIYFVQTTYFTSKQVT